MNRKGANLIGPLGSSGVVAQWGASSLVRSVQYVFSSVNAATVNITIAAVNPACAIALPCGHDTSYTGVANGTNQIGIVGVTSSTNLQISRGNWVGEAAYFVVIEFAPGVIKKIQQATASLSGVSQVTATITSVNTAKTMLVFTQKSPGDTGSASDLDWCLGTLTNATTLTFDRYRANAIYYPTPYVQVVEFF